MKIVSTIILSAAALALSACGGAGSEAANNSASENLSLPADDLGAGTDNSLGALPGDTLGNDANALGSDLGNGANSVESNLSGEGNALSNSQ